MKKNLLFICLLSMCILVMAEIRVFEINPQDVPELEKMFETFSSDNTRIYSDKNSGKVFVEDTADELNKFERLYQDLIGSHDPRQLMIEARIVEVRMNNDSDFGFEWELQKDFNMGSSKYRVDSDVTLPSAQYTTGGTFKLSTINSSDFDSILNLMMKKENVNIISNPKLFVKDGKEANILIGQKLPFRNSYMQNGTVRTDTDFMEVGVKLSVKADMMEDRDLINLVISPEISNFSAWSPGDNQPIIDTIRADTEVLVRDRNVIAIGGLIKVDINEEMRRVPVLSDIPLLGRAFRRTQRTRERKEIIIFLTPNIQRDPGESVQTDESSKVSEYSDDRIWYDVSRDSAEISVH